MIDISESCLNSTMARRAHLSLRTTNSTEKNIQAGLMLPNTQNYLSPVTVNNATAKIKQFFNRLSP
jgi:hypothetical protein